MNAVITSTDSSTASALKGRRLQSVRLLGEQRLSLHFHDGLIAELNFFDWLDEHRALMNDPLLDEAFFAQVFLDHGALSWPNGFDLHPDTVRHWAEQGFCD